MKTVLFPFIASVVLTLSAHAQVVSPLYSTDFTGTNGTTPTDWTSVSGSLTISSNTYRLSGGGSNNSLSIYSGDGAFAFEDYTVSTNFRIGAPSTGSYVGLISHYTDSSNFYQGRMLSTGTGGPFKLELYKHAGGVATLLAESATTFSYAGAQTWNLSFTVADGQLSLSVSDTSGSIVSSIFASDGTLTSGTAGVRATASSSGAIVYDDFAIVTAIPEPSVATVLFGVAGILVACGTRRRRVQR